jgi:superfamily II DNA/RNA helicase
MGHRVASLHGGLPQGRRTRVLHGLRTRDLRVLVATDVAARGIDVPSISHVINYGLPMKAEDYVHRIGRTARAGAEGDAISLGCEDFVQSLPDIEAYIGRSLPRAAVSESELADITVPARERRRFGGPGTGSRGGFGGGGRGRSGGGGGGGGGRRDVGRGPPRDHSRSEVRTERPAAAPSPMPSGPPREAGPSSDTPGTGAATGEPRKRRRRRRGGGQGPSGGGAPGGSAPNPPAEG